MLVLSQFYMPHRQQNVRYFFIYLSNILYFFFGGGGKVLFIYCYKRIANMYKLPINSLYAHLQFSKQRRINAFDSGENERGLSVASKKSGRIRFGAYKKT